MREVVNTGKEIWIMKYRIEDPDWYCYYDSRNALLHDFNNFVKDILEKDEVILTDEEIGKYRELLKTEEHKGTEINIEGTDYYIWIEKRQLWGFEE